MLDSAAYRGGALIVELGDGDDRLLVRGSGHDVSASGGAGNDWMRLGLASGALAGGPGNDRLFGGPAGKQRLYGGPGSDLLVGGGGMDHLDGGPGNDRLNARGNPRGAAHGDSISCGDGFDTVLFDTSAGSLRWLRARWREDPARRLGCERAVAKQWWSSRRSPVAQDGFTTRPRWWRQ